MTGLSTERIVAVATRISEEEGFQAISMRRVADELGVTAMALYGHVSNKHELLELIANRYLQELDLADDEPEWDRRLARIFRSFHELMEQRPVLGHVLVHQTVDGPAAYALAEVVLGVLREHGFEGPVAMELYWVLASFTLGSALGRRPRVGMDESAAHERISRLRRAGEYPTLSAVAEEYVRAPGSDLVGVGLDLLLGAYKQLPRQLAPRL